MFSIIVFLTIMISACNGKPTNNYKIIIENGQKPIYNIHWQNELYGTQRGYDPMNHDSTAIKASPNQSVLTGRKRFARIKAYIPLYLMLAPALIYVLINNYLPMGGLVLAFKQFNAGKGIFGSEWNHFANFDFLLKNKNLPIFLRNTVCYNIVFIMVNLIVGVFIALIITEIRGKRMRQFSQSIILFPFVVSIVIVSYMVRGFLDYNNGMFNAMTGIWKKSTGPLSWCSSAPGKV